MIEVAFIGDINNKMEGFTMKKKSILWMAIILVMLMSVACGGQDEGDNNGDNNALLSENGENVDGAVGILEIIWDTYGENEIFAALGGSGDKVVENAPGEFSVADKDSVDSTLGIPADKVELIDDLASLVHAMNANTFTAASYHVKDSSKVESLAQDISDNLADRQWICGIPEKLVIVRIGSNYAVSAFGAEQIVDNFVDKLSAEYKDTEILVEENIK